MLSGIRTACAYFFYRPELLVRSETIETFSGRAGCTGTLLYKCYPNAGLPNSLGQYDQTPEEMASEVKEYIDEGLVNIIGGCCGTTEEYIAKYQELIVSGSAWVSPHIPATTPERLWLSGLELLEQTPEMNFINVGERCNVAGSRKFLRLINEKKYEEALSIARKQVEDGALVIDVNMDDGLLAPGRR